MAKRVSEHGAGAVNLLITIVVVLAVVMTIAQLLPAQTRRSRMEDYMVEQTQTAIRTAPKTIEQRLYDKAREWRVPVDRKDIHVAKSNKGIKIRASYVEHLNFVVYTYDWKIDLIVDRPIYQF